jgi:hypothetical protein
VTSLNLKDPPRRVFRIAMGGLPTLNVDTLGQLPQPFNEIAYLWILDQRGQEQKTKRARLTQREVGRINEGIPRLSWPSRGLALLPRYEEARAAEASRHRTLGRSNFVVIMRSPNWKQAILDYTVGMDNAAPRPAVAAAGGSSKSNSATATCRKTAGGKGNRSRRLLPLRETKR